MPASGWHVVSSVPASNPAAPIDFAPSPRPTLGVEWEFALVDQHTRDLSNEATAVIAEIGDFSRFPDSKAIGRYAGLAPTVYASGNSNRLGHISKTGAPDLRWVLQQAAWTAIRCDAGFKKSWLRIAKTAGKKAAAVAIARKILVLMWTLVRKDELYKAREPIAA